jgi:type IV secretion system protein VirB9
MRSSVLAVLFMSVLSAQSNSDAVRAKRIAPSIQVSGDKNPENILDQYDFGAQVAALQDEPQAPATAAPKHPASSTTQSSAGVPGGFKPQSDVQLTQTAKEAVRMSETWLAEHNQIMAGRDGRVLYSFGAGLPTIVCAPLRVCIIELQTGEKLVGEPHIGDSVRWDISPALYGAGESATSVIVVKPQAAGLDTNLLITTDRRAYYLRLLSKPEDYVARVAFAYPGEEENQHKWRAQIEHQNELQRKATRIAELPANALESMHFAYRVKGGDDTMRPVRVFDDGKKTYIQMNPSITNREAPVLVIIGSDGKQEMVNYRVKDDLYIVDRIFERAALVLGSGRKARKVEIQRERRT